MAALQGYRTQQKIGQSQYQTYQQVGRAGSGSYAADTVSKVLWDTTPLNVPVEADSTKLIIKATAHTALPGDMLRFTSTSANPGIEVGVVKVTNDTIEIGGELPAQPLLADEFKIMRWITPTADQNGNLVFTPGPTTYNLNGVITTVAQDTTNAANNRALPSLVTYIEDGVQINVLEDTVTPANNKPLPVKLTGVTGDVIINAGDLNVSTDSTNDSMALGDAVTGDKANVRLNDDTVTFALKVKDDDANTKLAAIQTSAGLGATEATLATRATEATLDLVRIAAQSLALEDFATLAEQTTQTTRLTSIRDAVELIDNAVNTDGNPAGNAGLMIGGIDGAGDFQTARVNTSGELSVTFGAAGFATETTLSALNAKVANDYGAAAGAVRSAAQIGNATGAADFGVGADGAQTLRVSANLKRNGNELAYNSGAADANTLRSVLATRHEAAATPLASRLSDGTNFIGASSVNGTNQKVINTSGTCLKAAAFAMGFSASTSDHREIAVDASGKILVVPEQVSSVATVKQAAVTLGTSAIRLTHDGLAPSAARKSLKFIIEPPPGDVNYFYGSPTVTSSGATRGIRLYPGTFYDFGADGNDYYIISDAAAQTVFIVEVE